MDVVEVTYIPVGHTSKWKWKMAKSGRFETRNTTRHYSWGGICRRTAWRGTLVDGRHSEFAAEYVSFEDW